MAQRRAKGRQAVRNSSGGVPAWAWALVGAIAGGIFVVVLMHRSQLPMTPGPQANPQATAETPSEAGAVAPATTSSAAKKPQFDFYSVLSEKEVRIPDAEISAQAKAEHLWDSRAQQFRQALRRAPREHWLQCLARASRIDRMVKGREQGNPWQEAERLIAAIAEPRAARALA